MPDKMKAALLYGVKDVRVEQTDMPPMDEAKVLINIKPFNFIDTVDEKGQCDEIGRGKIDIEILEEVQQEVDKIVRNLAMINHNLLSIFPFRIPPNHRMLLCYKRKCSISPFTTSSRVSLVVPGTEVTIARS